MSSAEQEDDRIYTVVVNDEEQYSIWFAERDLPRGWRAMGQTGKKAECLAFIERAWTDMRPRSLRTWMAANPSTPLNEPAPSSFE
ncbi:MAG: mbtH [Myxococcaceae bacterium]|nr:mbtH [Myxococcaceae bacterium]